MPRMVPTTKSFSLPSVDIDATELSIFWIQITRLILTY